MSVPEGRWPRKSVQPEAQGQRPVRLVRGQGLLCPPFPQADRGQECVCACTPRALSPRRFHPPCELPSPAAVLSGSRDGPRGCVLPRVSAPGDSSDPGLSPGAVSLAEGAGSPHEAGRVFTLLFCLSPPPGRPATPADEAGGLYAE